MQTLTIRKGFEAFKYKFKPFEQNWNLSNKIRSIRIQFQTIHKGFEAFERKFEPFEKDLKHSNANSKHSNGNVNPLNEIWRIQMHILVIEKGL